jgi:CelD/BcsL family acetyltransferase involved in cellulose biosynthesis
VFQPSASEGLILLRIHQILRSDRRLRIVVLNEIPEDPNLQRQWNALVQRMDRPQVFYTYEWSLAVQRAYGAILRPLIFLAYDDQGSLCNLAALAADMEGACASFLCATTGDYCDFLCLPDTKPAFVTTVLAELRERGIREITLTNLPADSDTLSAIKRSSAECRYRSFARTAYICAQVALNKLERRASDNALVLPGKKMVRRSLKAMGQESPIRLVHARSWEEAAPILSDFVQAHVSRFQATGRVSNLACPERRLFLEELAKLLSGPGWFVLTRMMAGDRILAWNYGFQFDGTWFWYQPTFDTDLERYSPGFCLLTKLIEEAAAASSSFKMVDLGLGAEEYKERFANQTRKTLYVTLKTSMAKHMKEIVRYRTSEIIKTSPRLEAGARKVVARLRELKESDKS